MKSIGVMSTAALFLIFGSALPANARQEKPEEKARPAEEKQAKPEKQEPAKPAERQSQAKPEKQEQAKAPKQEPQAKPQKEQQAKAAKQEPQAKPEKQQQQAKAPKQEQAKPEKQQQQAKAQQQPHQQSVKSSQPPQRTQAAIARQRSQPALRLSARGSGRIPDDRFRASFGSGHNFHMGNPVLVGGYSRFQYSGFWFGFVQPWPVGWYYTDDVYIDYVDGGYYMYNPYHPGARFAISVVL
jgi:primosomal protein N'